MKYEYMVTFKRLSHIVMPESFYKPEPTDGWEHYSTVDRKDHLVYFWKRELPRKQFEDQEKQKVLMWIENYLLEEDFPLEHLDALSKIVALFNDCEESESDIFDFVINLFQKYAE